MKRQLKSVLTLGAAVLSAGIIFSGCDSQPGDSAKEKTYKVGAIFSVTGRASFLGDPEKKTTEMVVEKINAAGGINGTPIELIVMDSQGDATKATLAAKKLITKEKVLAIIGPSTSGNTMAIIPVVEKYKTPLISCAASSRIIRRKGDQRPYHWVFKTAQSDSAAVEAIFTHMQGKGIRKIGIMSVTSGFGASGRSELLRIAPQYGIEIVADEKYGPKDTDMTVQLTKIKSLNPQAVINWSVGPTQVTVVKNWKALGMSDVKMYQSHGFGSLKNIELAAGDAEGIYLPLGSMNIAKILKDDHVQKSITMNYLKEYTEKYDESLSSFGGHAWDAISVLVSALKAAGADKEKIRDAIENTTGFVGQHGVFNFSEKDHNGLDKTAFNMLVVKDGQWSFAD